MKKLIISADILDNKIYVNNLFDLKFKGKISIRYFDNEIYRGDIELSKGSVLWFLPYTKMICFSNIKVILFDDNGEFYSATPLIFTAFMRNDNSELNDLCNYIKSENNNIKNIIEIGSYQGESTLIFRDNFPDAKIFAVDPWITNYDDREVNINKFNPYDIENNFDSLTKEYTNIIKIKMFSSDFANLIADESIDFIYIDGDHSYKGASSDILCWKNKIKKGGFIGGHDYSDVQLDTVVKAIEENFSKDDVRTFQISWAIKII
jgi:hypothetical protein